MNVQFKSILFKERYYSISFKLKFILKSNLNVSPNTQCNFKSEVLLDMNMYDYTTIFISRSKFMLDKFIAYYNNTIDYHDNNYLDETTKYPHTNLFRTCEQYLRDGFLHRDDKPADIEYRSNGDVMIEMYYSFGNLHRDDNPACIVYHDNKKIYREEYYQNDELHNDNGPAIITYDEDGKLEEVEYYYEGIEIEKDEIVVIQLIKKVK